MRWPLKNQILTRMLLLLLVTIGVLTFANIRSVISANGVRESERIERIGSLLNHSRFPLTANVLGDMSSLSGAEFLLVDQAGSTLASTPNAPAHPPSVSASADVNRQAASPQPIVVNGKSYYHTRIKTIQQQNRLTPPGYVHVFVDRPSEFAIWKQASRMPLLIALVILTIALLLSLAFASQVTRPLTRLRHQVLKIAEGDMTQIPPPEKNDEIQDLGQAVNEMAAKLQDHDLRLRQNERLRTMVQFGSGVAHHLRNSATGCQMAIQLMAKEFDPIATSDNYEVAIRQLNLMNSYIKKFLLVSKASSPNSTAPPQRVDLHKTFTNVIFLLRPSARHLLVELADVSNCEGIYLEMQEEDAEQMMMNLIGNAITAASKSSQRADTIPAQVTIDLNIDSANKITCSVIDNGDGPPKEISNDLFQPFVTSSREGTGLGLSLVKEIADRVNGNIDWKREHGQTIFVFEFGILPKSPPESCSPSGKNA